MSHNARASALIAVASLAVPASAQFTLLADQRSVSSDVVLELIDPDDGKTLTVHDDSAQSTPQQSFAPFDASVLALVQPNAGDWGSGLAEIDSAASAQGLAASGRVEAQVSLGSAGPGSFATSGSTSRYSVVFQIDNPQLIEICAVIDADSPADGSGTSAESRIVFNRFEGASASVYYTYTSEQVGAVPYYYRLRLEPGLYEMEFSAHAGASTPSGNPGQAQASFEGYITWFGEPCNIADVEPPTGVLDLDDITGWIRGYLGAYDIYNPTYDPAEPFHVFDLSDLSAFVTHFFAGCE